VNTGGGGGGRGSDGSYGGGFSQALGGSGIVKIWYSGSPLATITGTGNTTTQVNGNTVHEFITSGNITFL
jgi:hypothetical protein